MSEKTVLKEIGVRISEQRKSMKLTQEALAEKIEVSTQMISNLELGKKAIRPENLIKICHALDVSADYILMGKAMEHRIDDVANKLINLNTEEMKIVESIIDYMNLHK